MHRKMSFYRLGLYGAAFDSTIRPKTPLTHVGFFFHLHFLQILHSVPNLSENSIKTKKYTPLRSVPTWVNGVPSSSKMFRSRTAAHFFVVGGTQKSPLKHNDARARDLPESRGCVAREEVERTDNSVVSRRTPDWEGFVARCGLDCERGPERGAFDGAYAKCETGSAFKTCWRGASKGS